MWKLRITYKKKSKRKVDQFKFESPDIPQSDEQLATPQIEPFKNIFKDPMLYELLKEWAANNNINSRRSYIQYQKNNGTVNLNGRTFALPPVASLPETFLTFYRDVIQPESQNLLTKEILFQILDYYFKDQNIILTNESYSRFIKQNRRTISVMDENGKRKAGTGILFNGQIYPVPNELRTETQTGNRKFDTQAMSWLREYRNQQLNIQGTSDETVKYLWEADENTLTQIIINIIGIKKMQN